MSNSVAVVLSTYNGEKYLDSFLDSLTTQDYSDFTLYVRDDGSKDRTVEIINEYTDRLNLKFFSEKNIGYIKSFASLFSYVTEDIVFLADQDDVWHSSKISTFLPYFRDNCFVHCNATLIDSESDETCSDYHEVYNRLVKPLNVIQAILNPNVTGCCVAVRREVAEHAIKLSSNVPHDRLLLFISLSYGTVGYIPEKLVNYRQHSGNTIGVKQPNSHIIYKIFNMYNTARSYRKFINEGKILLDRNIYHTDVHNSLQVLYSHNPLNAKEKVSLILKNLSWSFANNVPKRMFLLLCILI